MDGRGRLRWNRVFAKGAEDHGRYRANHLDRGVGAAVRRGRRLLLAARASLKQPDAITFTFLSWTTRPRCHWSYAVVPSFCLEVIYVVDAGNYLAVDVGIRIRIQCRRRTDPSPLGRGFDRRGREPAFGTTSGLA